MSCVVGSIVRVVKCDVCPAIISKTAKVVAMTDVAGQPGVQVSFGRGRPQKGRPTVLVMDDVAVIDGDS